MIPLMVGTALALFALAFVLQPLFFPPSQTREASGETGKLSCPNCGLRPETDADFCSNCGRPLSA